MLFIKFLEVVVIKANAILLIKDDMSVLQENQHPCTVFGKKMFMLLTGKHRDYCFYQ